MFTRTAGIVAAGTQNRRVISVGYRICYRTHRNVGYCGALGYCAATVTELTEVVCGVTTDGNYVPPV